MYLTLEEKLPFSDKISKNKIFIMFMELHVSRKHILQTNILNVLKNLVFNFLYKILNIFLSFYKNVYKNEKLYLCSVKVSFY